MVDYGPRRDHWTEGISLAFVRSRNAILLALLVPSAITNCIFYSCVYRFSCQETLNALLCLTRIGY